MSVKRVYEKRLANFPRSTIRGFLVFLRAFQFRNPNIELRNKFKIRNPNAQNSTIRSTTSLPSSSDTPTACPNFKPLPNKTLLNVLGDHMVHRTQQHGPVQQRSHPLQMFALRDLLCRIFVPNDAQVISLFATDHVPISIAVQVKQLDAIKLDTLRAANLVVLPLASLV